MFAQEDVGAHRKVVVWLCRMVKTKRIKRNWGEEDLKILIWIVSKYCDYKGILDIEKDMVRVISRRAKKIGGLWPRSSLESQQRPVCLSGSASKKSPSQPTTGNPENPNFSLN